MALPLQLRLSRGTSTPALTRNSAAAIANQPQRQAPACSGLSLPLSCLDHRQTAVQRQHSAARPCSRSRRTVTAAAAAPQFSAAAQLIQAVQVPPGRDVAAMLFAAAGAVAWVKMFDYFARHEILEQVRRPLARVTDATLLPAAPARLYQRLHTPQGIPSVADGKPIAHPPLLRRS